MLLVQLAVEEAGSSPLGKFAPLVGIFVVGAILLADMLILLNLPKHKALFALLLLGAPFGPAVYIWMQRNAEGGVPEQAWYALPAGLVGWVVFAVIAGRMIRDARLKADIIEFKQKHANKPMPTE